jgi:hypothetical protein
VSVHHTPKIALEGGNSSTPKPKVGVMDPKIGALSQPGGTSGGGTPVQRTRSGKKN